MAVEANLTFDDFVGNAQSVQKIRLLTDAAKSNNTRLPHMAFIGSPGNGKTTMAKIVADYMERRFVYVNSVAVKDSMVFRGLITHPDNMKHGAVIVLDECHRLPASVQDHLLSVTEEPAELVTVHKGVLVRDKLSSHMSFIFATTHGGQLRDALLSRLELIEFGEYTTEEKQIIAAKYLHRAHGLKGASMETEAIMEIGRRSRSGRHVVRICDNIIRYMNIYKAEKVTVEVVNMVFSILGIDPNGLTARDISLLGYLENNGRCGLSTLEAYLNMPQKDIREKVEPYLLRIGLIERQMSGRAITSRGIKALRGERIDV
jgi:Holliday junction DNA helicase RuvB